jgi:hypothetical protein
MINMLMDKPRAKVLREPRREMPKQPAWFTVDGVTRCDCVVLDVSPGGAKITTDAAIDIHDRFGLALVPSHSKRQRCEVVWRRGNIYGLRFLF